MRTAALIPFLVALAIGESFAGLPGKPSKLKEGVYAHTDPYNKEIVELRNGHFRYWFSSDMKTNLDPTYPLSGPYDYKDGVLVLHHEQIYQSKFRFRAFKGVATLWNDIALSYWRTHPNDKQFRTLFEQQYTPEEIWRSDLHRRLKWND
jgi:hypothetical protein